MSRPKLKEVLLENGAGKYGFSRDVLGRLPGGVSIKILDGTEPAIEQDRREGMGKDVLHLLDYKGEFLKPCPGTREYICCGYQILNVATNCPLDCSYCILQGYFNQPYLRVFANLEEGLQKALDVLDSNPDRIFRIGTGEFTDSLALDPITCWSDILLPPFSKRKNVVLELKTKTTHIERVFASKYRERIILSWSLNSALMALHEEHRAASIKKRLEAASRSQSEGFVIAFHFDPLITHPGWKDEYLKTIELMDKMIDPTGIIWISLGSFRFMPQLKGIIRKRHPHTSVLDGEFIRGLDGKMRYFKPIRIELYSFMKENLEKWYNDLGLYLCMEADDVWEKSLGWSPGKSEGLVSYLDNRVIQFFGGIY